MRTVQANEGEILPRIHPILRARSRELRTNQTPAEATLWYRLRDGRMNGLKFRRQHPLGPYIADFYIGSHKLVIELDGAGHLYRQDYDQARTEWLNQQGYTVIRFTNDQVRYQPDEVLTAILWAIQSTQDE